MTIGEVARRFGLATHVLRHWERVGLLEPARVEGARRRYGTEDLYRVAAILLAKQVGFGLEDIREMFAAQDPADRQDALRRHRTTLLRRIAEAQASLELIEHALDCSHEDIAQCPHFRAGLDARIALRPPDAARSSPSPPRATRR
jgi:DNA-binding transcriptional MerR regulator